MRPKGWGVVLLKGIITFICFGLFSFRRFALLICIWISISMYKIPGGDWQLWAMHIPFTFISWSVDLGWEASSWSFAESLSVRALSAGPKTVARSFALLRLETLARTLFAIFFKKITETDKKTKEKETRRRIPIVNGNDNKRIVEIDCWLFFPAFFLPLRV